MDFARAHTRLTSLHQHFVEIANDHPQLCLELEPRGDGMVFHLTRRTAKCLEVRFEDLCEELGSILRRIRPPWLPARVFDVPGDRDLAYAALLECAGARVRLQEPVHNDPRDVVVFIQMRATGTRSLDDVEHEAVNMVIKLLRMSEERMVVPDDLISVQEAADLIGVSEKTIVRRIKGGVLKNHGEGRSPRVSRDEVLGVGRLSIQRRPRTKARGNVSDKPRT